MMGKVKRFLKGFKHIGGNYEKSMNVHGDITRLQNEIDELRNELEEARRIHDEEIREVRDIFVSCATDSQKVSELYDIIFKKITEK